MKLCMGIIEDALGRPGIFKNYTNTTNQFVLDQCEIYCGQPVLKAGILYVAEAGLLSDFVSVQSGSAMICVGIPSEVFTKAPLLLLVVGADNKLDELSNRVSSIFNEYNSLEYKLLEFVSKGRSIQSMVELMAPYFNQNELFVNTNEFKFIGQSNQFCRLCEVSNLSQPDPEILPQEVVTFFKNDIIWKNVMNLTEPFIYEPSIFSVCCLCMNVFYGGEFICRVVVPEDRNSYREYDAGLLRFFTAFIQLVFDMSKLNGNVFPKEHTVEMYTKLLRGEYVEKWRLENSLGQRNWLTTGPFLLVCIIPSERDFSSRTVPFYCQTFNRDFQGCCFFEFERYIVCIVSLQYYNASLECFYSNHLETFRDANFRVGYSTVFSDIMELRPHYLQAIIALKIGMERQQSQWHHKFSDTVMYYLQSKMTEELDGRFLCASEIAALVRYDKENHSDYLRTLKVYLDNEMNTLKTAKDLFVHRTTMEYRLNRIKELTGIDFNDADRILYLRMSIKFFSNY